MNKIQEKQNLTNTELIEKHTSTLNNYYNMNIVLKTYPSKETDIIVLFFWNNIIKQKFI